MFFFTDIGRMDHWKSKESTIVINNTSLGVKEFFSDANNKDGSTLVFLHDALGCITSWKDFPERLCKALHMNGMIYDRKGHGRSDISTEERTVGYLEKEALEVLPSVLKQLGTKKPILIGSSDGGSIALVYGAKYPVEAIVSIAGHSKVEPITLEGIRDSIVVLKTPPLFQKLERLHGSKAKKLLNDWADTWLSPAFRNWNIHAYLSLIESPALVLQGEKDNYATPSHVEGIVTAIPGHTESALVEGCGHFPHLEQPEVIMEHIKTFLRGQLKQNEKDVK